MESIIYIASPDDSFTETLCHLVAEWGVIVHHDVLPETTTIAEHQGTLAAALLDIRRDEHLALKLLQAIKRKYPAVEVILINRPENIRVSMAGMQLGAGDEIIAPFDTAELKSKVKAACRRHERLRRKKERRHLLDRFSDSMSAVTFAQAGEYETAADFLDRAEADSRPPNKPTNET